MKYPFAIALFLSVMLLLAYTNPSFLFTEYLAHAGSTGGSVEYVRRRFPQVKVVELGRNCGFAEGNNREVKFASGDYLIFVNMDTKAERRVACKPYKSCR